MLGLPGRASGVITVCRFQKGVCSSSVGRAAVSGGARGLSLHQWEETHCELSRSRCSRSACGEEGKGLDIPAERREGLSRPTCPNPQPPLCPLLTPFSAFPRAFSGLQLSPLQSVP